ncbi:MAG: hypothetical protein LBB88_09775 [Planctomycetaceae bacterium]|nr:hypothetical protein [Planctomycetaceae bacterium]
MILINKTPVKTQCLASLLIINAKIKSLMGISKNSILFKPRSGFPK